MVKKAFDGFNASVTFGGVSIGENTARVSITLDRKLIHLNMADQLFCNRRLIGKVALGGIDEANNGNETQGKLIDDVDHEVSGAFDVKGFRCSADVIAFGITFSLKDIDIAELAKFSKGHGRLIVNQATDIPEEPKPEKPISGNHTPSTLKLTGPRRKVSLDDLFDPTKTVRKALANANIDNVGQLADYTASGKRLTDIDGIGQTKADEIEERMVQFWKDNPENEADIAEEKELATA